MIATAIVDQLHGYDATNTQFFEVPQESDWMVFHVDCGPPLASWNVYTVRDPQGRVRYQHLDVNCPRTIIVHRSETLTSLGAVAGPITAGRWRIDFTRLPPLKLYYECGSGHLHSDFFDFRPIFPDPNRDYWAELPETDSAFIYSGYDWERSLKIGGRWYRGDCHMHTILSDGSLSPDQLNNQALQQGLEFIIVTDHLTQPTSWPRTELLVIPGIEVTTTAGHFNALGPRCWLDWHPSARDGGMTAERGMRRVLQDAAAAGAVRVLNHPMHKDFHWTFHTTPLEQIDVLEIINAPQNREFKSGNEQTLAIWTALWNHGYTVPGSGGSDFHHNAPFHQDGEEMRLGDPSTYVFAGELSARAILDGIRRGHIWVSRGPQLEIDIRLDGQPQLPGADLGAALAASPEGLVQYRINVSGAQGGTVCWIENGETIAVQKLKEPKTNFEHTFAWKESAYSWARVDIRSAAGEVVAFVNPIFCGAKKPEIFTWEEAVGAAGHLMLDLKEPGILNW